MIKEWGIGRILEINNKVIGSMIHLMQLTGGKGRQAIPLTGFWGPKEPTPSSLRTRRGGKDDSNVAPFLYDQARCIHPPFVECYAVQTFSIAHLILTLS